MKNTPLLARLLLIRPETVARRLERARAAGLVDEVPNLWQLTLGIFRMWHRMATRPSSIGLSSKHPVRSSFVARMAAPRLLRGVPAILAGAVRPWDLTGLLTGPRGLIRHLVAAHHDRHQFAYDLQILSLWPEHMATALAEARRVGAGAAARDRFLRDLAVYEGYHDTLIEALERAQHGDFMLSEDEQTNPDVSFAAYLRWCRRQPETPAATIAAWRRGELDFDAHA